MRAIACDASPRSARPEPDTMGETPATAGNPSNSGTSACQLATERKRCARGWVSVNAAASGNAGAAGVTRSSGARSVTCACAPSVLARVLACRPLMSAEM